MTHTTVVYMQPGDLDSTLPSASGPGGSGGGWHKLVAICRLLHRDKLDYRVTIMPHAGRILIEGWGQVRAKRPLRTRWAPPDPPDESRAHKALERARLVLVARKRDLVEQWSWWRDGRREAPVYDSHQREIRQRFGHWLASRLARRPRGFRDLESFVPNVSDYKSGDAEFGRQLPRYSDLHRHDVECKGWVKTVALRTFGIWWWYRAGVGHQQDAPEPAETPGLVRPEWVGRFWAAQARQPQEPSTLHQYWVAKLGVEYWQEILRLLVEGRENAK